MALRDRYLLKDNKRPIITDERYCEINGLDPDIYANNRDNMREYFIDQQTDKMKAEDQYDEYLARNGLLIPE